MESSGDCGWESKPNVPCINKRALPKDATTYRLETFKKNLLLVFCPYEETLETKERADSILLTKTFEAFGFDVDIHYYKIKNDIRNKIWDYIVTDFTEYGCIGVVVQVYDASLPMWLAEWGLIYLLIDGNNKTLVTKPKFFIIQACNNCLNMSGFTRAKGGYSLPEDADFFILHSCYTGDPVGGSWFIEILCDTIEELADDHDFKSIITEVSNRAVSRYKEEVKKLDPDQEKHFEACDDPVTRTRLIRKLYLRKYGGAAPVNGEQETSASVQIANK